MASGYGVEVDAPSIAGGTTIIINKADGSNMAASTNGTTVYGSITFEVN